MQAPSPLSPLTPDYLHKPISQLNKAFLLLKMGGDFVEIGFQYFDQPVGRDISYARILANSKLAKMSSFSSSG